MKTFLVIFTVVMNLLLVDVATKEMALKRLPESVPHTVVEGVFNFTLVKNRGCAWGMFQGQVWPLAAFAILAMAAIIWKRKAVFDTSEITASPDVVRFAASAAECMLYAGILGNLLDRVFRGFVVDMLDFHWGAHHFPCFNVADSYITIAAAILVILSFLPRKTNGRKN